MEYDVTFDDGYKIEEQEFHSVSHDRLRKNVKKWMENDGRFEQADVYSKDGRYLFTIYL